MAVYLSKMAATMLGTSRDRKRERNTNAKDGIKYKIAQAERQEDDYFPADGHQAILNKTNKQSKTIRD